MDLKILIVALLFVIGCVEDVETTVPIVPMVPMDSAEPTSPLITLPPEAFREVPVSTKEKYDLWTHDEMLEGAGGLWRGK